MIEHCLVKSSLNISSISMVQSQVLSTVKHYYKILAEENVLFNGVKQAREEIRIDLKTYNSLASALLLRRAETQYEYEEAENEKKKTHKNT